MWGISCGVGEEDIDGTVCQPFQTQTADGYVCTCNTSLCVYIGRTLQSLEPQDLVSALGKETLHLIVIASNFCPIKISWNVKF